jgi:hypothetical protein
MDIVSIVEVRANQSNLSKNDHDAVKQAHEMSSNLPNQSYWLRRN